METDTSLCFHGGEGGREPGATLCIQKNSRGKEEGLDVLDAIDMV